MHKGQQPPVLASLLLACFSDPHMPEIMGDLMEEFEERVQSSGLSTARRWYWREAVRNAIALLRRRGMTRKVSPKALFVSAAIWFSIALLSGWLTHAWISKANEQAWGPITAVVLVAYFVLVIGWVVPFVWAFVRLASASRPRDEQSR